MTFFTRHEDEGRTLGSLVDTAALQKLAGVCLDPSLLIDEIVTPAFMDEEPSEDPLVTAILFG